MHGEDVARMAQQLKLRVKAPSGTTSTISVQADHTVGQLREVLGTMVNLEMENFEMLVGYPPRPLVGEDITPCSNVLANGEVVVVKQIGAISAAVSTSATTMTANSDASDRRRTHVKGGCPPGIDEETWGALDEETRNELALEFSGDESEDDEDTTFMDGDGGGNQDLDIARRAIGQRIPMPMPMPMPMSMQVTHPPSTIPDDSNKRGGISFGARVATLSSNGQATSVQRTSFGPGSRPRTFGARVATLPKSTGG